MATRKKTVTTKKPARTTKKSEILSEEELYPDTQSYESNAHSTLPFISKKYIITLLVVLAIIGLIVWKKNWFVVAMVNGKPITSIQFVDRLVKDNGTQTLDNMINEQLLFDEAKKENITVSDDEINKKIDELKQQFSAQGMTLEQLMQSRGLTMADIRNQIKIQILADKLITQKIAVSDQEVQDYIKANQQLLPATDSAGQAQAAKEALLQQKQAQAVPQWIADQTKKSQILKFL